MQERSRAVCQPRRAVLGALCWGKELPLSGGQQGAFVPTGPRGSRGWNTKIKAWAVGCAATRSPLEVVVAMGSIVGSFPPGLYILHLAFHRVNNNANSFCSWSCLFTVFPPFATYNE